MAKTTETTELERSIWSATTKLGTFSCFEVTIGIGGSERVDYMTLDTKGTWRCYEIKVSLRDFRSKAKTTFCGHYNYYVLTEELYEKVYAEIPAHVGVYVNGICKKKAKKQPLLVDEEILKLSMIRSLSRDTDKMMRSGDVERLMQLNRKNSRLETEAKNERRGRRDLESALYQKFGRDWRNVIDDV